VFFGDDHVMGGPDNRVTNLYLSEEFRRDEFSQVGAKLKEGSYVTANHSTNGILFLGFGVSDDGKVVFNDPEKALASLLYANLSAGVLAETVNGLIDLFPNNMRYQDFFRAFAKSYDIRVKTPQEIKTLWSGYHLESNPVDSFWRTGATQHVPDV
jgi:hypothetical protein